MSSAAVATATSSPSSTTSSMTVTTREHHQRHKMELKAVSTQDDRDPLPVDLRRILVEVARIGACSSLTWNDPVEQKPPGFEPSSKAFDPQQQRQGLPFSPTMATMPSRKKHRNGIHINPRRFGDAGSNGARKRPLGRTSSLTSSTLSIGSGSEIDDSTQYECDSEGTSATTNSELSVERRGRLKRVTIIQTLANPANRVISSKYKSLREAVRTAIGLVLDHSFRFRGGYKLTTSELRKYQAQHQASDFQVGQHESDGKHEAEEEASDRKKYSQGKTKGPSPEEAFQKRRKILLALVGTVEVDEAEVGDNGAEITREFKRANQKAIPHRNGPPFTLQRLAEVLIAPERYYTQTHKLCNCLEKLLLVTSSIDAFGGSTGGETYQTRREERELAALADETERQESEQRNRRSRRRLSSSVDNSPGNESHSKDGSDGEKGTDNSMTSDNEEQRELLEAAAKAQLRHKFDHIGGEHHHGAGASLGLSESQEIRGMGGNRSMTTSPPPPSILNSPNLAAVASFVRHLTEQHQHVLPGGDGVAISADGVHSHHPLVARPPSPILFPSGGDSGLNNHAALHSSHGLHLLQMHHSAAMAGLVTGNSPLDIDFDPYVAKSALQAVANSSSDAAATEFENQSGRSSASNSDVDSESDDISLDDSASDRSDGSDSGFGQTYEPFTAARVMALNRMQQQQRLQLNRQTLQHGGEAFRPPADHEYQSGDSIDSMMAEDSGGSDSSSSDLAD